MANEQIDDLYNFFHKHIPSIDFDTFYSHLTNSTESNHNNRSKALTLENFIGKIVTDPKIQKQALKSFENDKKGIISLYNRYKHPYSPNMKIADLIIDFCYIALAQNTCRFATPFFRDKLKPDTINATIRREADAAQLRSMLDTYKKVIVSGGLGIGKTRLIRYCLTKWNDITDYCYLSFDNQNDIKTNLRNIQYINSYDETYWGSEHELKSKDFSSSLLIIDNMYNSPNLSEDLKCLSELNVKIIVVMLHPIKTESFQVYELPELSEKDLSTTFETDSGFPIHSNELLEQLFTATGHNALLISLIAKLCKHILKKSSCEDPTIVLHNILDSMEYPDNHDRNFHIRYKYNKKTMDIVGHMKSIYKEYFKHIDKNLHNYMKCLSCFGGSQLPRDFVSSIIPNFKDEKIELLHDIGLISLTKDSVQLSVLVSHAAFAYENPHPSQVDFRIILNKVIQFLEEYDDNLSIPYLSNSLLIFAQTLYNKVTIQNNKRQTKTAKDFERWQDLIYLIEDYYYQNGNNFIADKVAALINYPEGLKNLHSRLDPYLFQLCNNMQRESFIDELPDQADKLCSYISEHPDLIENATYIQRIMDVLDFIIFHLCNTDFDIFYLERYNMFTYRQSLIIAMQRLVLKIYAPHHEKLPISDEKLNYYSLCFQLTIHPELIESIYTNGFSVFKKSKNINYRIRCIAFLLFKLSSYIYGICPNKEDSSYQDLDPFMLFESFIVPEMNYLRTKIQECKIIPTQTFKICSCAYISIATLQHYLLSSDKVSKRSIKPEFNADFLKELTIRCTLSKDEKDKMVTKIDEVILEK